MKRTEINFNKSGGHRNTIAVVWLFVPVVLGLLFLSYLSLNILSAGRAYVSGESQWSKAQKDSMFHLASYARSGKEEDWMRYESAVSIILGNRLARIELEKAVPDLTVARSGFLQGGHHPADIDGMFWLYRTFREQELAMHAVKLWSQADAHFDELQAVALQLRGERQRNELSDEDLANLLTSIRAINGKLMPLQLEFSDTLGEMLRRIRFYVITALVVGAFLMLGFALLISMRLTRLQKREEEAHAKSESNLRELLWAAPLPLVISQPDEGQLLYVNEQGRKLLGIQGPMPIYMNLYDRYSDKRERSSMLDLMKEKKSLSDYEVMLTDANGRHFWAIVSARNIMWEGSECAFVSIMDIDERKRLQEDMRHRAFHDYLTDLPNRAMFLEALNRALARNRRNDKLLSMLFIDLDRFKEVNDTLGHAIGDQLLQSVAQRLKTAVREYDLVARLGGDEFVVLMEAHDHAMDPAKVADSLVAAMGKPFRLGEREVSISCSIGISSWPAHGTDAVTLVKNADIAMYQAKAHGRNMHMFYSASLDTLSVKKLDLEMRLRNALANEEYELVYQPVADLRTGRIVTLEALLRWRDPQLGMTLPGEFIRIAEESGLIVPIGEWALRTACQQLASWRREPGLEHLRLAVNLSARQFLSDQLMDQIESAVDDAGLYPADVDFEVTESEMIRDVARTRHLLQALRRRGAGVSMDDFGIGHSSLAQLRRLPADSIKIDKSFIAECGEHKSGTAIVQAIIAMAHSMGLRVIAEGVESPEQLRLLQLLGCDEAQGWHLSRPLAAEQVPYSVRELSWPFPSGDEVLRLHAA